MMDILHNEFAFVLYSPYIFSNGIFRHLSYHNNTNRIIHLFYPDTAQASHQQPS